MTLLAELRKTVILVLELKDIIFRTVSRFRIIGKYVGTVLYPKMMGEVTMEADVKSR